MKWFIDGNLVTAVYGDDLQETSQTEIPSEPMYLVMNLAVSKDWGFPDAWFLDCPKKCWSCFDPECTCALPKGFCESMPTTFDIESVRVYQPKNERGYSRGCSPPNRQTKEFIDSHKDLYKLHEDENPLRAVKIGGGDCTYDRDCGTVIRGTCNQNRTCTCTGNWTGPNCLAHGGWEEWSSPYYGPSNGVTWMIILVLCACALLAVQLKSISCDKSEKHMYRILNSISSPKPAEQDTDFTGIESDGYESYQKGRHRGDLDGLLQDGGSKGMTTCQSHRQNSHRRL